jgi:uncharacterized protein YkwD
MLTRKHIFLAFSAAFCVLALASTAAAATKRTTVSSFLEAVNATRAQHGLGSLRVDPSLVRAARAHSTEMLRSNVFSHGDFSSRMAAFHVAGPAAGENLAWGNGPYAAPSTVISEWLASPEHRANLLRPGWTRIGIGLARGTFLGNGGSTVVTADFAGR